MEATRPPVRVAVAVAGCAALAVVGVLDPAVDRLASPCPLRSLTGLDCPLCGATRATHALLRLDVRGALDLNALYVVLVPVVAVAVVAWLWRGRLPAWAARREVAWGLLAVAMVFGVVRNLPWSPFTSLGT